MCRTAITYTQTPLQCGGRCAASLAHDSYGILEQLIIVARCASQFAAIAAGFTSALVVIFLRCLQQLFVVFCGSLGSPEITYCTDLIFTHQWSMDTV